MLSYAFDLSTFDLFAASRVGAAVWIIRKEQQHDVSALLKGIEQYQVTIWYSVPTVLSMLVASGELTSQYTDLLRHVIFAGEPYPMGALRHLCECLSSHCQLSNWYGPTGNQCLFCVSFSSCQPRVK
ncbi:AMP-binding protein [Vibrio sp. PP-XX7]